MRGLIKAIIAVMLFVALYVPCNANDVGIKGRNAEQVVSVVSPSSVNAAIHHANGGESGSRNHCQPDGLMVVFSAPATEDGVKSVFNLASASAFPGQKLAVIQRPPIFRA